MTVKNTSLITLSSALDWLGLTSDGGSQDARLEMLIDAASEQIENYCGRKLSRAAVIDERRAGYAHIIDLPLTRPPINNADVSTMVFKYHDDVIADTSNLLIDDAEAGIVRSQTGWRESASRRGGIAGSLQAGTERSFYKISYDGGYVTEVQSTTTGGDYEGFTVTLPMVFKTTALNIVSILWDAVGVNANIKSQKIGDAAESYGNSISAVPDSIFAAVNNFKMDFGF